MAISFKSLIKTGFGLGLGVSAAQILIGFIGMLFFIPGYTYDGRYRLWYIDGEPWRYVIEIF